jgi:hypothetical protein
MAQAMFNLMAARVAMMLDECWPEMVRVGYGWRNSVRLAIDSGYVPFGEDSE